ncbi:hypothetical protein [Pseudonocardia sp. MH-G8]|uniref:hypothetical protein n=1 Tax=Pseudonocardia sp. MH-G8 TaxID=1854588 RepID=UPI000BA0C7CF|nr:hypothetical protein [Pseudonocardia sp. MH-G8]OZM76561.1 hypothetical protein CFP66_40355 [Pseudonocardia sp. MH-G8]
MDGDAGGGLLRGAALAGLSALLTAVGHCAGGGAAPDLAVLVVLFPPLAGLFTSLAERCRRIPSAIAVLGAGQFALHQIMELLHPAHQAAVQPVLPPGIQMLAMHGAATLATAIALAHADRALVALRRAMSRVLPRRLYPPPANRPLPVLAIPSPAIQARLARAHAVAHVRRGPPVGC